LASSRPNLVLLDISMLRLTLLVTAVATQLASPGVARAQDTPPGLGANDVAEGEAKPRKRALLIGVSKYDHGRGLDPNTGKPLDWWDLSCESDIEALKGVLTKSFTFADPDILVLTDEEATRDGIVAAFRAHLITGAKPGDVAYFHFSGHGQRVADDDGDEYDGLDESLIPFDYKTQSARDGAVTNLRDDTLGELLGELQRNMSDGGKFQGSITVTVDCCFSGTATRGDPPAGRLTRRGRGWLVDVDGPLPLPAAVRGRPENGSGLLSRGEAANQDYVLIAASSHEQLASQWSDPVHGEMGAFTSFLVREWEATPQATHRSAFERVDYNLRAAIRDQNPQLEGAADTLLFSGTGVPRERYVVVQRVDGELLTLPVGEVDPEWPARKGSVYYIYRADGDVTNPADKIAEAVVTETRGASCTARLSGPSRSDLKAARAVEVERGYGDEPPLRVLVAEGVPPALAAEVAGVKVATTAGVTDDNFDVRIGPAPDSPGRVLLERKAAAFAILDPEAEDAARRLRDALRDEWRTRFLLRLNNPARDSLVLVDLRIVPADVKLDASGQVLAASRRPGIQDDEGLTSGDFRDGDHFMLEVRNRSDGPAYVTILHFQPDGSVYCLYPEFDEEGRYEASKDWVPLGGRLAHRFVFQAEALRDENKKPLATPAVDTFKLIATRQSANYHRLLPTRRVATREADEVRREVASHPSRGEAAGGRAPAYDLARLLGTASLGEDPDPDNKLRSQLLPVAVTDWSTATVKAESRPAVGE
jgi:hypothetical protein